ncbi:MAG: hypothetical protein KBA31_05150 [Alphaproteobacteria bacterium]|nr:hypothetical protein [Alphaproteobacteria bacterium]
MPESTGGSRWRHFFLMLPFFLIGVAIPVYFFGFSGDGPPIMPKSENTFDPGAPAPDGSADGYSAPTQRSFSVDRPGIVAFARDVFENVVDTYVSPNLSPLTIKLGFLGALFVGGFLALRILLAVISGTVSGVVGFLVHKAAGPMFMGFLAVGSTWGIHQTIAEQFGVQWAATTVSLTAAVAALFALAGVKIR